MNIPEGYISLRDWADKVGYDESTIRHWIYKGKIESVKILNVNGRAQYYIAEDAPVPKRKSKYDSHGNPFCPNRDCFLNHCERCHGLTDCLYKEGKCPFFRHKDAVKKK